MQNRDGVGRRSQSYLPTLVEQAVDNAARLIHEYRLPVQVAGAHPGSADMRLGRPPRIDVPRARYGASLIGTVRT
jgi:hypothetical protein